MKTRTYLISVNDKIDSAITIEGNSLQDIASKTESLVKKFMEYNYGSNPHIWQRMGNLSYYTVDPKSGTHFSVRLKFLRTWAEDKISKF